MDELAISLVLSVRLFNYWQTQSSGSVFAFDEPGSEPVSKFFPSLHDLRLNHGRTPSSWASQLTRSGGASLEIQKANTQLGTIRPRTDF